MTLYKNTVSNLLWNSLIKLMSIEELNPSNNKMKNYFTILILIFACSGFVNSQKLPKSDQQFVDSLTSINNNTVYVFLEYNGSSRTGIIEGKTENTHRGCSYNSEYWIVWIENGGDTINSKISNNCYFFQPKRYSDTLLINDFNELFNRLFIDSSTVDTTLYNASLARKHLRPVDPFYTITKYNGAKEYPINFGNYLFYLDYKDKNPTSIDSLIYKLLTQFKTEKTRLNKTGIKNEDQWH